MLLLVFIIYSMPKYFRIAYDRFIYFCLHIKILLINNKTFASIFVSLRFVAYYISNRIMQLLYDKIYNNYN